MTRALIEEFAKIVKPFVQKRLLKENFEGMGEQDRAEFGRDFDEIISLAIKGLEGSCWIPVTERLPRKDGLYLVSVKNDHLRRYSKTCWYSDKNWFARQDVVAWIPLPEPFKGGE